ncbi:PAS domain S-box protein, partial [Streptomyces longispororuber]|uniref:PAS domain S-box protein n=1 Tax=Streptomyces longispororuber TaxID=68230 RepID=UPI00210CA6F4
MHGTGRPPQARVPLAVVVIDQAGRVSHWSTGARRLFGPARDDAVGRPATDLMPVSGALPDRRDPTDPAAHGAYDLAGHDLEESLGGQASYPAAGRARLDTSAGPQNRIDVLWWAYPLVGPGPERMLVL